MAEMPFYGVEATARATVDGVAGLVLRSK